MKAYRDAFYSPALAGENILKACVTMRAGLISKVRINFFNNIEARVEGIAKINAMGLKELKKVYAASFNPATK